ncbi:MAG: hypothetical protein J5545_02875 [Bacteroidaceae bacterium]|nr:hypothetical protein [Bacteroidaceae bacterium]
MEDLINEESATKVGIMWESSKKNAEKVIIRRKKEQRKEKNEGKMM